MVQGETDKATGNLLLPRASVLVSHAQDSPAARLPTQRLRLTEPVLLDLPTASCLPLDIS